MEGSWYEASWLKAPTYSKEEGKCQKSIQSSTTPDPGHHTGKWQNTRKHHIQESQGIRHFPDGDHKATMNRQDSMTATKHKWQKRSTKEAPPWNAQ